MNIHDFPNYLIFDDGKVFSKYKNDYMTHRINKAGYHHISLSNNGKEKNFYIHRLVAIHYLPNPNNLPEIDHINRDKSDNRVQNLRWSSKIENAQNKGMFKNNKTGHKGITFVNSTNRWKYQKNYRGYSKQRSFKTKTEALCYKYIILLKIKSGIF
jgi:hypothetical protein